ncbi:MAG: CHAT domain-containing protein [Cyanobacteria bacterium P01_D01_bin.73]
MGTLGRAIASKLALGLALGLSMGTPAAAVPPQVIEGELTADDRVAGDGTYLDFYRFEGKAGDIVAIELNSDDFDARLGIFQADGELLRGDDDGGDRTNSLIIIELPEDGVYFAGANSINVGEQGRYQLKFRDVTSIEKRYLKASQVAAAARQLYLRAQMQEALAKYHEALELYRALGDRDWESVMLSNLSLAYADLGRFAEALKHAQAALDIDRELGDRQGESRVLISLGVVYGRQGQHDKALASYNQALEIVREVGDRRGEGTILNNIAITYGRQERYAEALEYYEASLVILREVGNRAAEGGTLNNMGAAYMHQGENALAIEHYEAGLEIARELGDRAGEATALNNLGALYGGQDNNPKALEYYQASLALLRETGNRTRTSTTLANIAIVYQNMGDLAQSEGAWRESLEVYEAIERDLRENDDDRIAFFETQSYAYSNLEQVLAAQDKAGAALEIADRARGRSLAEFLNPKAAYSSNNQGRSPFTIEQIKQLARDQNATLITYSMAWKTLLIWVVSPSGRVTFQRVDPDSVGLPLETIDTRVRSSATNPLNPNFFGQERYRFLVSSTRSNGGSSWVGDPKDLKRAYELLIKPIESQLPKKEGDRLIIVPHRELGTVPFVALIDGNDRFLLDRYSIAVTPSLQILNTVQQKPESSEGKPLIVGNPSPMPSENGGSALAPLPGAEIEAQAIAQAINTSPLIGNQATEATIKKRLANASLLHFATHGIVANSDRDAGDSWLALADTKSGTEDGKLTLTEIFNTTLNAQLAVLSACNTNSGEVTGEGVLGLARAFLKAGVPAVVASLWQVPDKSTQVLMEAFYEELLAGETYANALRTAQLKVRAQSPNPRDWAAFMVIGDGDRTLVQP